MGITNSQAEIELRHLLLSTAFTQPTQIWTGLFTAGYTDSTAGVELTSTSGYVRIATSTWEFSSRYATNSTIITFPTATQPQTSVVAFGLFGTSTVTEPLRFAALTTFKQAASGDTLRFSTGAIVIKYNASTDI